MLMQDIALAREWSAEAMDEFDGTRRLVVARVRLDVATRSRSFSSASSTRRAPRFDGSIATLVDVGDLKMANACAIAEAMIERFSGDTERLGGRV